MRSGCRHEIRNVGIISTRIAGTDGVSLEIAKWAECLERNDMECFYLCGECDRTNDRSMVSEVFQFTHPEIKQIYDHVFGRTVRDRDVSIGIHHLRHHIKLQIEEFVRKFDIDMIIPENVLAIPLNIPLGLAITEYIAETGIPAIAHHHDFSWERNRFLVNAIQDYLLMAFPPDLPSIQHVVINSLNAIQLSHRRGISNTIIPNVYDFDNPPEAPDEYALSLKSRISPPPQRFVLQPTRIVGRKGIEKAIEIVANMNMKNPTLVLSHKSGDEGDAYLEKIQHYAEQNSVHLADLEPLVRTERGRDSFGRDLFTMGDAYKCCDLVTYPSTYEGFGNAFLEAIYYGKPIVVNRYSIYVTDIAPKGFKVVAMDEVVTKHTIEKIMDFLENTEVREESAVFNYEMGRKYFSFTVAEKNLLNLICTFTD